MNLQERFRNFIEETKYDQIGSLSKINIDLYHYTSASAMKSILDNRSLRFTKIDFMNDVEEIEYALHLLDNLIDENKNLTDERKEKIKDQIIIKRKDYFFGNTYVMSFSSDGDLLPVWTHYGREDGYSIKFAKELFRAMDYSDTTFIGSGTNSGNYHTYFIRVNEVIYDNDVQKHIIEDLLNEIDVFDRNNGEKYINILLNLIVDILVFFKNPGHKSEKEYRLVVTFENSSYKEHILKHRVFKGAFIPYVEYPINLNYIRKIKIGPNNKFDLVKKGLESYVSSNPLLKNIEIEESKMILRF